MQKIIAELFINFGSYFLHQELLSALFLTTITYYDVTQPSWGGLTGPAGPGSRRPSGNFPCKSALPCISSCRLASCWTQVCNRDISFKRLSY